MEINLTKDLISSDVSRQNILNNGYAIVNNSISQSKEYISYNLTNTPPPPLDNVPKRGFYL
jgi:hypothetical protein